MVIQEKGSSQRSRKEKTGAIFLLNIGLRRQNRLYIKSSAIDKNASSGAKDRNIGNVTRKPPSPPNTIAHFWILLISSLKNSSALAK